MGVDSKRGQNKTTPQALLHQPARSPQARTHMRATNRGATQMKAISTQSVTQLNFKRNVPLHTPANSSRELPSARGRNDRPAVWSRQWQPRFFHPFHFAEILPPFCACVCGSSSTTIGNRSEGLMLDACARWPVCFSPSPACTHLSARCDDGTRGRW